MANIRVDLNHAPLDGEAVTFKAPCNASDITGLVIYYDDGGATVSKAFTLTDANGNDIGVLDNIFAEGAIVKAILDTDGNKAYIQNPNTNTYLENRFEDIEERMYGENLLDNWYFADPVDQRGGWVVPPGTGYYDVWGGSVTGSTDGYYTAVHTPGGYTDQYQITINGAVKYVVQSKLVRGYKGGQYAYSIDRWRFNDGTENVLTVKANDFVTFSDAKNNVAQYKEWSQLIENPSKFVGKTVTLSALVKNTSGSGNRLIVVFKSGDSSKSDIPAATGTNLVSFTFVVKDTATAGMFRCGFQILNDYSGSMDIIAVKLELGSQQTLAHQDASGNWVLNDPPPDKNMELLKCCMSTADSSDTYANQKVTITTKSMEACTTLKEIHTLLGDGYSVRLTGGIGRMHNTNLKTLLNGAELSNIFSTNYIIAIAERVSDCAIRLTATDATNGDDFAEAYIYGSNNGNTWNWTGWHSSECRVVNGVQEYINPPMQLGVEYRTTERHDGKPVYVRIIELPALSVGAENAGARTSISSEQLCLNCACLVRYDMFIYPADGGGMQRLPAFDGTSGKIMAMGSLNQSNVSSGEVYLYGSIYTFRDLSSYKASVTAWYTKTTD